MGRRRVLVINGVQEVTHLMDKLCLNLRSTIKGNLAHLRAHTSRCTCVCLENPFRRAGRVDLDPSATLNASESKLNDPSLSPT